MSVDLRTCVPGQKLKSKHGLIFTYVTYAPEQTCPHIVQYPQKTPYGKYNLGSRDDDCFYS